NIVKEGEDLTVIAWGGMVREAMKAVKKVEQENNCTCEIIDLRSIVPLDAETVIESVKKTGRAVIIHEAHQTAGFAGEIISLINEEALIYLRSPIKRIVGFDVPVPQFLSENDYLPTVDRMVEGMKETVHF